MKLDNIYLGDAYKLIKEIPNKSVDLIITDPPYLIEGLGKRTGILRDKSRFSNNGSYIGENLDKNSTLFKGIDLSILDDFVRVMKDINIYIWCNKEQIYDYMTYFVKERDCNFEILILAKDTQPPFINNHFLKDKEYCLYFWEKGKIQLKRDAKLLHTIYNVKINDTQKERKLYKHPTIKPLWVIKNMVEVSSNRGG